MCHVKSKKLRHQSLALSLITFLSDLMVRELVQPVLSPPCLAVYATTCLLMMANLQAEILSEKCFIIVGGF